MMVTKIFFKPINNSVSSKNMENVEKHRDIKLLSTEIRRSYLVSGPNYHSTKSFKDNLKKNSNTQE